MRVTLLRPWHVLRDLMVNRNRPDLEGLAAIRDPERFVWTILPHAARTFSTPIALLPERASRAAAVAYLYCRALDTYEDLSRDPVECRDAMRSFATRLAGDGPPPPPPPLDSSQARDERDRAHLLLVSRCDLLDRVYESLSPPVRSLIRELVLDMADGMCWSSRALAEQGGVFTDFDQVARYCRAVIGEPVLFMIRLVRWLRTGRTEVEPELRRDAMRVGEMVQLANITRDIEKDLTRGVAYRPALAGDLGPARDRPTGWMERVRTARRELLVMALERVRSYRSVLRAMERPGLSPARASAVLMLLYTDRYFRSCARRAGLTPWPGRTGGPALLLEALPTAWSRTRADRLCQRVERDFLRAARAGGG